MNINICSIEDRENCVKKVISQCIQFKSHSYVLLGPEGSGKQHSINKIYKDLVPRKNITVLEFVDDQLICKSEKYRTSKTHFEINASFYLGFAISREENNQSNLNYIITLLKSLSNTNIVIIQPNLESLSDCAFMILQTIANNKSFIEKNTEKLLTIICSCEENNIEQLADFNFDYRFIFANYSLVDINYIFTKEMNVDKINTSDFKKKLKKIYDITNGNFDLINIIYTDVFNNSLEYSNSLSEIVDFRLQYIKHNKKTEIITGRELEDIIITGSLCIDCFNRHIIAYSTKNDEHKVQEGLRIYAAERLLEETCNQYHFVSNDIKNILMKRDVVANKSLYIELYNYSSKYKSDSYYERAFYLMQYHGNVNLNVLSLFFLSIAKSYMLGELWRIEKINKIIKNAEKSFIEMLLHFENANDLFEKKHYVEAISELNQINENTTNNIIRAEVARLKFKCFYYNNDTNNIECIKTINKLKEIIKKDIKVEFQEPGFKSFDEFAFRLRIIFELAPCIIDDFNDFQTFEKLYTLSIKISKKIESLNLGTFTTKYIINVFNRKAFLFSNPMSADVYYEEAKAFFYSNNILDEYCITLICYAGTLLFTTEYDKALSLCEEAEKIVRNNNINIPTPEKLFNNYCLADFLGKEQKLNKIEAIKYAAKISNKLYQKAMKLPNGSSKNVILTNVASLALYSNNYDLYHSVKNELELSIGCKDVSNLTDLSINDFYRYHFTWFELFYNIHNGHWEECNRIFLQLENFIPSLFKKAEDIIRKKNISVRDIINKRQQVDGYDFSNYLVSLTDKNGSYNQLYYRGLPLSDLQYTSFN